MYYLLVLKDCKGDTEVSRRRMVVVNILDVVKMETETDDIENQN